MSNPLSDIQSSFKENPLLWGMFYFPHHFRDSSPAFHLKILKEAMNNRFLAIAAPRGSAKTTILIFLRPIHGICFKQFKHIIIIQNTFKKAAGNLLTIKSEFKDNEKLKTDLGVEIIKDAEEEAIFLHPDGFKTRVLCKGAEQMGSIRGEKFGAFRPDLILGDDIESDEMMRNPEVRQNLQEAWDDAVEPSIDAQTGRINVVGTVLHDDSLIKKLVTKEYYVDYRKLFYMARWVNKNKETTSLWPEKWTVQDLNKLEQENPRKFAKEYQNDPVSGMMANFDKEDFRKWHIENDHYLLHDADGRIISKGSLKHCRAAIGCDLAWEEKRSADDSVLMPAFITPNSEILVDTYIKMKGMRPNQMEEYLFSMSDRYEKITGMKPQIGFEKAKLEKVMKFLMREAGKRRNQFLRFKDVPWVTDKVERMVAPLEPRYKQHMIFHRSGMGDLENQLLRIPSGKHDDLPDALQIVVRLLQNPRSKPLERQNETPFDRLYNEVVKPRRKAKYIFGQKAKPLSPIPARINPLE